jgi:molecular chaperone GrpE
MAEQDTPNAALQGQYQLLQDQFTRLAADFDNYRKRTRDEQESLIKYGAQKSIMELLPVLDNLERATGSLSENSDPKLLYKSFSMMRQQLLDGLDAMGVKKIQAVGQTFDPLLHEAVNQMESAEFPEDTVMHEAQSGYQLHDKVIRPAMVVVSTGSPQEALPAAVGTEADEKPRNPFVK